jgi:hypothetical protein
MHTSRIIERIYDPHLLKSLRSQLITVLIGPRQSGKTTSVNRFLDNVHDKRKFSLNLDSSFERERVRNNEFYLKDKIEEVIGFSLENAKEKFYLFIDEAQKLPLIFETVKILYDKYQNILKIILSGSSGLELLDKTAETLAGRVQILRIFPFSMAEASRYENRGESELSRTLYESLFSGTLNKKLLSLLLKELKPKSSGKIQLIDKLITRSLFPPTFSKMEEDDISRWLVDYIDTYVERDMRSVKEIGNIEGYRRLIIQLSARIGNLLEYHNLGTDAGINQITAKKYVTIWQESLIGFLLSPFHINISTRIKKSRKVYFFDNALVWALTGFKERKILEASGDIGHYFENLMITDFIKWGINLEKPPTFYFWEKSHASEIDLVISSGGYIIPVEIKNTTSWDKKYLHAINMFKEKHKGKKIEIPFSLIIYRGEVCMPAEDVFSIPAWMLC